MLPKKLDNLDNQEKSLNNCLGFQNLVGRERFERSTNGLKVRKKQNSQNSIY